MFKLCVKFEQNRTICCRVIDDLAIYFRGVVVPNSTPQRGGGPISSKFGENRAPSSMHQLWNFGSDMLLRFVITAAQKKNDVENDAKFSTF